MTDREKMIHNEKVKLHTTFYNNIILAVFSVLGLGASIQIAFTEMPIESLVVVILVSIITSFLILMALHRLAMKNLDKLL